MARVGLSGGGESPVFRIEKAEWADGQMEMVTQGYRGLSFLVNLNGDRLLYIGTIAFALGLGAFIGSLFG